MIKDDTIKNKSLKSVKWIALGMFLPKLITPFITILLAKLLLPSDFGLIAICTVFIGAVNLIQGLGLSDYIIKELEVDDSFLSTAFWLNLALSSLIFFLMWILAPVIANIYQEPKISDILPMLGLVVVFNGIGTVHWTLLQKHMQFKKMFAIQFLPIFVSICITLPLAYLNYGVWALVAGELSKSFLSNAGYVLVGKWVPRIYFSIFAAKQMLLFGGWIIVEKLQEFFYSNLDRIILGYYGGVSTLGIYTIARQIIYLIYNSINGPISGIIYPMLSKLQSEIGTMRKLFFEVSERMMLVNIPVTFAIAILSYDFIPRFFAANKWPDLPLLITIGVLGEVASRNVWAQRDIFKLLNRPDLYPKSIIVNLLFAIVFYPLGAINGLIVFSIVRALNEWVYAITQVILASKILDFRFMQFIRLSFSSLLASIVMVVGIVLTFLTFEVLELRSNIIFIFVVLIVAITFYFIFFRIYSKDEYKKYWGELKIIIGLS